MKKLLLIVFFLGSVTVYGQLVSRTIWTVDEVLNLELSDILNGIPMYSTNLLYLDSTVSGKLIDAEFKNGFLRKNNDSIGIYDYDMPNLTIDIAENFRDKYAVEKLWQYYQQLPKFIKSDTMYCDFEKLLSIFVYYKPKGINQILKKDFYEWQKLSEKSPAKKFLSREAFLEEMKTNPTEQELKLKKEDLYTDCNRILLQLACALQLLQEPEFDNNLINQLRKKQNSFAGERYVFPTIYKIRTYSNYHFFSEKKVELKKTYSDMEILIKDYSVFQKAVLTDNFDCKIHRIIYNNNKAYVSTSFATGGMDFVVILKDDNLVVKQVFMVIE